MELVKEIASKGPESQENIAIRVDEKSYTYLQLVSSARSISSLLSNLDPKFGNGIKRNVEPGGARVGIIAKPCAEFVAGVLGTWISGGVAVPLVLSYPVTELLRVMNDSVDFIPNFCVREIWQRWCESYPADRTKTDNAITVFSGVPTMYTQLIQCYEEMDPELKAASASAAMHLRLMMSGSSALLLPIMQQWETITGHRLLESYGMMEFVMAISSPIRGKRKAGTVGNPFPGVQAKILLDDESGTDKSGIGELCIKSPLLFKEYWKLPEVTNESLTDDGLFKTGDAVTVDEDGNYIILGHKYI